MRNRSRSKTSPRRCRPGRDSLPLRLSPQLAFHRRRELLLLGGCHFLHRPGQLLSLLRGHAVDLCSQALLLIRGQRAGLTNTRIRILQGQLRRNQRRRRGNGCPGQDQGEKSKSASGDHTARTATEWPHTSFLFSIRYKRASVKILTISAFSMPRLPFCGRRRECLRWRSCPHGMRIRRSAL